MASLVIRPEKIGDLVVATPVFRALKESFPDEPVHLLVDETCAALVTHDRHIDRIIPVRWRDRHRGGHLPLPGLFSLIRKNGPYRRAVILYPGWNPWNWLAGLAGIPRVAQIAGTWSALAWRHAMVLRRNHASGEPMSELYLQVAAKAGAHVPEPGSSFPQLYITDAEKEAIRERFPALRAPDKIFVHAFSLSTGANLTPAGYFNLCHHLVETTPFRIYLLGTEAEGRGVTLPVHPRISTELVGKLSLREMAAACTQADLLIGGSSGVIHVAAALGVPTLGLYCPSYQHHLVWGPRGRWAKVLISPPETCRRNGASTGPCGWPGFCDLSFAFPPELVRREAEELISRARNAPSDPG
jgi:ADP-heptose:LPS heptosyltransferase